MSALQGHRLVLGVTGSIAAFKAAALASKLRQADATVRVVLTPAAERFVSRLTFEALTGEAVMTEVWEERPDVHIGHVELARWAEALIVAPASANTIARLALGLADNALGAVALATEAPLLLAPAMETHMFHHPATQLHLAALRARGATIVGPETGHLASGVRGDGRMVEPDEIMAALARMLVEPSSQRMADLDGVGIVVSAGPTREPLDPVRYLSNHSSGKMGYALVAAAHRRGARVTLVSGPVETRLKDSLPEGLTRVDVETAEQMCRAVVDAARAADVVIMAAAVADFRPAQYAPRKIKKDGPITAISLEPTPDILEALRDAAPAALRVGFAAETDDLVAHAQEKLRRKGLALIVANDVSGEHSPFGSDYNRVVLIQPEAPAQELPLLQKREVADRILDEIATLLESQSRLSQPNRLLRPSSKGTTSG